jgi:hypothetical protein
VREGELGFENSGCERGEEARRDERRRGRPMEVAVYGNGDVQGFESWLAFEEQCSGRSGRRFRQCHRTMRKGWRSPLVLVSSLAPVLLLRRKD